VLHERLTQRFVDRRAAALARARKAGGSLAAAVSDQGEVTVEGEVAGKLEGFNFVADAEARDGSRDFLAAANTALRRDAGERVRRFLVAADSEFSLDERGFVRWQGQPVGRLVAGDTPLAPRVEALPADLLEPRHRDDVRRRLQDWLAAHLGRRLGPLLALRDAPLKGSARGLAYELAFHLGCVARPTVAMQIEALGKLDRQALAGLGVHIGQMAVYLPVLRGRDSTVLRALLWACAHAHDAAACVRAIPQSRSVPRREARLPAGFYGACQYLPVGPVLARVDRLEGLAGRLRGLAKRGPFAATDDFAAAIGVAPRDLAAVLAALGYRAMPGMVFVPRPGRRVSRQAATPDQASPFASLSRLKTR
jgi:ATP-dependent RNA helicase SUPV3L1/SUV3